MLSFSYIFEFQALINKNNFIADFYTLEDRINVEGSGFWPRYMLSSN